jgi:HlyD family secretion protein
VLVVGADNLLEERQLEVGLSNWQYAEVTKGLQSGERVVTSINREGVKAGVLVAVETENPKP